jgi:acid phosphatase (class A)
VVVQAAGYLAEATLQTLADAVPSPPAPGSRAARADIVASDRLRPLEHSDRWLLATRHAEMRPAFAVSHFDCTLGFSVTAADSPRLVSLLERVFHDAHTTAEEAKARAFRPRPVGVDPQRPACQVASDAGRASASYPSGSAAVGVAYSAALAALVPEQAAALTGIGRAMAQSRMICGLHYPADVAAGEALGQAVFRQIAATPAFARDAAAAREDLARAQIAGRISPACAAERAALATPLP